MVATVKVEVAGLGDVTVTGLGLNAQVLFAGHPLTVSVTLPLKVFRGVRVNGNLAMAPSLTVSVVVLDEMEKSERTTTNTTDVVWVSVPSVPWIVMVYEPAGVVLLVWTVKVDGG